MTVKQTQIDRLFQQMILAQSEVADMLDKPLFKEAEKELKNWSWGDFPKRMRYGLGTVYFYNENDKCVAFITLHSDSQFEKHWLVFS